MEAGFLVIVVVFGLLLGRFLDFFMALVGCEGSREVPNVHCVLANPDCVPVHELGNGISDRSDENGEGW